MILPSTTQRSNKMKLISIDQGFGHTNVMVERSDIEYCVVIDNFNDEKNAVYENFTGKKIRRNSQRHEMFCFFAQSKMHQASATK
jgi:hypothetical protein